MRRLQLKVQPKLVAIHKKIERREARREVKASTAARLTKTIENELLARLKSGTYGDIYNFPQQEYNTAVGKAQDEYEKENPETEQESEDEYEQEVEQEEDEEDQVQFVVGDFESDDEDDLEDLGNLFTATKKSGKDADVKRKRRRGGKDNRGTTKRPTIVMEYEQEHETEETTN